MTSYTLVFGMTALLLFLVERSTSRNLWLPHFERHVWHYLLTLAGAALVPFVASLGVRREAPRLCKLGLYNLLASPLLLAVFVFFVTR